MTTAAALLKPDCLDGPHAMTPHDAALDLLQSLLRAFGAPMEQLQPFLHPDAPFGHRWATRNVDNKAKLHAWYSIQLRSRDECLASLMRLHDSVRSSGVNIATDILVLSIFECLGFRPLRRIRHTMSHRDFLGLYQGNVQFIRLHRPLQRYLVGKEVLLLLLLGQQELGALQVAKEFIRRMLKYRITHYDATENLLHVADPGSNDERYLVRLLQGEAVGRSFEQWENRHG